MASWMRASSSSTRRGTGRRRSIISRGWTTSAGRWSVVSRPSPSRRLNRRVSTSALSPPPVRSAISTCAARWLGAPSFRRWCSGWRPSAPAIRSLTLPCRRKVREREISARAETFSRAAGPQGWGWRTPFVPAFSPRVTSVLPQWKSRILQPPRPNGRGLILSAQGLRATPSYGLLRTSGRRDRFRPDGSLRKSARIELHMVVAENAPLIIGRRQRGDLNQRSWMNVLQRPDPDRHVGHEIMFERAELAVLIAPAVRNRGEEPGERRKPRTGLAEDDTSGRDDASHDGKPAEDRGASRAERMAGNDELAAGVPSEVPILLKDLV